MPIDKTSSLILFIALYSGAIGYQLSAIDHLLEIFYLGRIPTCLESCLDICYLTFIWSDNILGF